MGFRVQGSGGKGSGGRGPQLNMLRLSSSKNLTGQAGVRAGISEGGKVRSLEDGVAGLWVSGKPGYKN